MTEPGRQDEFAAYFQSDLHKKRLEAAVVRYVAQLSEIGKSDIYAAFSEAIGMAFAVGHFYRHLGLKHKGAKVFREVFSWMKKGTD